MILNMPTERGEAHAHIEPRQFHPTYISCDVSQHRCIQHWHVVQVPATSEVMLLGHKGVQVWKTLIQSYYRVDDFHYL